MANPKTDPTDNTKKDPDEWVSGDNPMTGAQASYLKTLCEQAGEPERFDDDLTKFSVHAYFDGHELSATAETAKDAFEKAIEWRIVGRLADVAISDGTRCYSIVEFSSVMALDEIANTIKGDINTDEDILRNSN